MRAYNQSTQQHAFSVWPPCRLLPTTFKMPPLPSCRFGCLDASPTLRLSKPSSNATLSLRSAQVFYIIQYCTCKVKNNYFFKLGEILDTSLGNQYTVFTSSFSNDRTKSHQRQTIYQSLSLAFSGNTILLVQ